jgi:tetratricopeptide (TPR) repeat protein
MIEIAVFLRSSCKAPCSSVVYKRLLTLSSFVGLLAVARPDKAAIANAFLLGLDYFPQESNRTIEAEKLTVTLVSVAEGLAQAKLYDRAIGLARTIKECNLYASTMAFIVKQLVQARQFDRSIRIARAITLDQAFWHIDALCAVAEAYVHEKRREEAKSLCDEAYKLIPKITKPDERAITLRTIATIIALIGNEARAMQLVQTIEKDDLRAIGMQMIAKALAQTEQYDPAMKLLQTITDPAHRIRVIADMAPILAVTDDYYSIAINQVQSIEEPSERAIVLSSVAITLAQKDRITQAIELAQTIDSTILARRIADPSQRAIVMGGIPQVLAQASAFDDAIALCDEIALLGVEPSESAPRALISILSTAAQAFAQVGKIDPSRGLLERALSFCNQATEIARSIEDHYEAALALRSLAQVLAQADLPTKALLLCDKASSRAGNIENIEKRADVQAYITQTLTQAGYYKEAFDLAHKIEQAGQRGAALVIISDILSQRQETDQQLDFIQRGWSIANARGYLLQLLAMASQIIISKPNLDFISAFAWVSQSLQGQNDL